MKIVKPSVELLWITPDAVKMIEKAGRTCYRSGDKIAEGSADKFIKMLLSRGHDAMIEHASASLKFICDRGVTHEMVRHRPPSYAQESTRYCNYSKEKFGNEITVIEPPDLTGYQREAWEFACLCCEKQYINLIEAGCTPQIARSVLPNCLKTEIVMTCNFREWRHVFKLRCAPAAHPQIREVMNIALNILKKEASVVFEDLNF